MQKNNVISIFCRSGIHTIQEYLDVGPAVISSLVKQYKAEKSGNFIIKRRKRYTKFIYTGYSHLGVTVVMLQGKQLRKIQFIINPSRMNGTKFPSTALYYQTKESYDAVKKTLDGILEEMGLENYRYKHLTPSRIDITLDIPLESEDMAEAYVRLARYLPFPKKYERARYTIRKKDRTDSENRADLKFKNRHSTRFRSDNVTITLYSKRAQAEHEGILESDNPIRPTLRIEASFQKSYLVQHYVNHICATKRSLYKYCGRSAWDILRRLFDGLGENKTYYLQYSAAKECVYTNIRKKPIADRMVALMDVAKRYQSLRKAKELLLVGKNGDPLTASQLRTVEDNFKRLKLSPITIPKEFHVRALPTIRSLLKESGFLELYPREEGAW